MKTIEQTIKMIADKKGLKQTALADAVGVTQPGLSKILLGENQIKFKYLIRFADAFGMSVVDLLTYPEVYGPKTETETCRNCYEKDRIIESLNDLIQKYRNEVKALKTNV